MQQKLPLVNPVKKFSSLRLKLKLSSFHLLYLSEQNAAQVVSYSKTETSQIKNKLINKQCSVKKNK